MRRIGIVVGLLAAMGFAVAVHARIGGGETYSGNSSSSSSSSSSGSSSYGGSDSYSGGGGSSSGSSSTSTGGSASFAFMFFVFVGIMLVSGIGNAMKAGERNEPMTISTEVAPPVEMSALRQFDANFSQIVFTDFCYSLFARVHEARGRGRLGDLAPYVSASVREGMARYSEGVTDVSQIVIGSFAVTEFRGIHTPTVTARVEIEANYTETKSGGPQRWYVRETWTLERARDLLSPSPEKARAEHCPKCGAALQTRTDGACLHCGTVIADGTFQWFVRSIAVRQKDTRQPNLRGFHAEVGTDLPTLYAPWFDKRRVTFARDHPGFTWEAFDERVRHVANELQAAWTSRDWNRARHYETGALFQMHRYWIDEYLQQGLRNVVDEFTIYRVEPVKIASDAFYDAITVRMFASGFDYTVDDAGTVVGGSRTMRRDWSEYWTLVRGRAGVAADAKVCPNCGGSLAEGQTAVCEYCGGKVTTGDFPWILSRIEQDESYRGGLSL